MGYLELFLIAFIFSFGGIFIKAASQMVTTPVITWFRWGFGFLCLLIYMIVRKRRITWRFTTRILWIGALVKSMHYFFENLGVSMGVSYGGILVWPVQTIVVTLFSVYLFKEKLSKRNACSVFLCLVGIVIVSFKGELLGDVTLVGGLLRVLIFVIAGTGAALFTIVQKYLNSHMEADDACLNMYLMGSMMMLIPIPFSGIIPAGGAFHLSAVAGLLFLGAVTGFAFLIQADALKKVPMYIVPTIQSTTVILTIFWGWLFRHEAVSPNVYIGTLVFIIGVLIMDKS